MRKGFPLGFKGSSPKRFLFRQRNHPYKERIHLFFVPRIWVAFFLNWKKRFSVEKLISRQKATRELRIESLKSNVLCVVVEQIMQWCWLSFPSPSIFCSFPGYRLDRTATQRFFLYIETLLDSIFGCRRSFSKRIWQQKFVILAKEARRF